ncbi:TonB-dependent siderophore receptor [Pseudorhodoferax sp.]|uniref:TonB-dependent siderophore receptor n=1 Tax=Pseudorhodoferax sp. TaxID=1993553 RepID=UPI002DD680C2|nr:TonB-dependent siderophore receptor [Pseudorhodoferax sp.]
MLRPLLRPTALATRALLLGAALALSAPAFAQAPAGAGTSLQVPAGPLEDALNSLARQAGITLSFDPALVQGLRAPALGSLRNVEDGLAALLAPHRLQATRTASGAWLVRAVGAGADLRLPSLTVTAQAERESAWGATPGYTARRSGAAMKMDVPLLETPQQVSTIGAEQIRDQAIASVAEAVRYSAGVRPADYGITDDDVSVRGFYLTGTGLYRDGMRLIHNGFMTNLEPYGLERLEVVHGPASVLYGQSAPGGLINAVTKRPRAGQLREVGIEGGSHERRQITADIGGALNAQGTLLGRLTVLDRQAGTQWDGLRADRRYVAPALTLLGERTSLTLLAQHQEDETGFVIPYYRQTPAGPADEHINVNGPGSGHKKRNTSLGWLLEHRFSDTLVLRNNLRHLDGRNDRREMRNRGLLADQRSMARLAMVRPDAEETWVMDTQLEGRLQHGAVSHQWAVGVDYYRSRLDWRIQSLNGAVPPLDIVNPAYRAPDWNDNFLSDQALAQTRQLGVYLQDQVKFGERWVLSAGLRWDRATIDTDYRARLTAGAAFDLTEVNRRDTATTGRLGLIYLAPNGLAPYVAWNNAFQPPLTTVTATDANGQPYQPETARQVEAGLRYAPAHSGYVLSAAVFDLRKRNVRTPSTINPRVDVQTGEVRSRGVELQGSGTLGGGFSAIAAYTWLDAEVLRSNTAAEVGARPGATPRHMASLWGKYQRGGLELGLGARYISATPGELRMADTPTPMNDSYTLWDAMAAYSTGPWRFSLNASNLFDKRYRTQCNTFRGGAQFCALGFERELRVAAAYRF